MLIALARLKDRVRKVSLIGRIGMKLRLEAQAKVFLIFLSALSSERAVKIVSRIKLDTDFRGIELQFPATLWVVERGGQLGLRHLFFAEYKIMVVATRIPGNLPDPRADPLSRSEIERRFLETGQFTGWNAGLVKCGVLR